MLSVDEFNKLIKKLGYTQEEIVKHISNALMQYDFDLEEIANLLDISVEHIKKIIAESHRTDLLVKLTIGERIDTLLKENNINADKLARELEISKATISDLLNDVEKNYGYNIFVKIAKYFNVSTDYILGLSNVKSPQIIVKQIHNYTSLSEKTINMFHDLATNKDDEILNDIRIRQINIFLESPTFKFLIDKLFVIGYSDININTSINCKSLDDSDISKNITKIEHDLNFAKSLYFDLQQSILEYYQQTSSLNIAELERFYNELMTERNNRIKQDNYHPKATFECLQFLLDIKKGEYNAND